MAETAETSNFDEFQGKDCVFLADWLKTKERFMFIVYKYVLSNKPCLHAQLQKHNRSY